MPDFPSSPEELTPLSPQVFHILVSLADRDQHGYAVMMDVAARTNGSIRMSAGTLYGSIQRILEQGLIEEVRNRRALGEDERRRYYRITEFGRRVVAAEASRLDEALQLARAIGILPAKA